MKLFELTGVKSQCDKDTGPGPNPWKGPPEPQKGEKLASYTDDDGYTIEIVWGTPPGKETALGTKRYGTMYITSPKGKKIQTGYWMNWPEKDWHICTPYWEGMPYKERAKLEVKQQATKYDSLKNQFKHHEPLTPV